MGVLETNPGRTGGYAEDAPVDAVLCKLREATSAQLHADATDVNLGASR